MSIETSNFGLKHGFYEEIKHNKSAEVVSTEGIEIKCEHSSLDIRLRGCFITDCELIDPVSGREIDVLYCDPKKIYIPKLPASHPMMPVSKSKGPGGQHGFPRWADYHKFELSDNEGEKIVSFQAKRSDQGPGLTKVFKLSESRLRTRTIATNYQAETVHTSLGEHLYFSLPDENTDGLLVNGKTLDELLGENAECDVMSGGSKLYEAFDGTVEIYFPSGYKVKLAAQVSQPGKLGLIVWHRPGSESICFEPTFGFDKETGNEGLAIKPWQEVELTTTIELIS